MRAVGADGCRSGWLAVVIDGQRMRAEFHVGLAGLIAAHDGAAIAVDIPVGLAAGPAGRGADKAARAALGPRRSSIFTPPCREALAARDYPEANATQRLVLGQGLSKQAWMLARKMREADAAITPEMQNRVFESHPEVAFATAAGAPLAHPKRAFHGVFERLRILHGSGLDPSALAADLPEGINAQPDDLLDACILAHVARRRIAGEAIRLPVSSTRDGRGLLMEIWA